MPNPIKFVVLEPRETIPVTGSNLIALGYDNWDDWFEFETAYQVYYYDEVGLRSNLGSIKIGQVGQKGRRAVLPREFYQLPEDVFSVV